MTGRRKRDSIHPSSERMEAITCGGNQLKQQFKPGDIAWIKIRGNSWWPAQVIDEKTVGNKPKKKAKDEILVRQYGTYEYLYMDPWKSSSDFEKFLKQENCNAGEAFQRCLEEDLLRLKSAGKSKRKVSKSEVEAPKGKKQKQDKIQRNWEATGAVFPGCPSDKLKEMRAEQGKDRPRDDSQTDKKINQDNIRKPKIAEKARAAGSKIKVKKQYNLRQPKHHNVEKRVKGNVKGEAFKHKGAEQGEVRKNVIEKAKCGTSKVKNTNQDGSRQTKFKDVKVQVTLMVRDESSKAINETDGVSEVKNVKQMGSRLPKHNDTKEHHTESPGLNKYGTPQERGDLSARRTRVMQSLGLIAPLGSPFRRNGLVEAAVLKL